MLKKQIKGVIDEILPGIMRLRGKNQCILARRIDIFEPSLSEGGSYALVESDGTWMIVCQTGYAASVMVQSESLDDVLKWGMSFLLWHSYEGCEEETDD